MPESVTSPTEPATEPDAPDVDHMIDAAGFDSFPASDPPGWWSGAEPPYVRPPDAPPRLVRRQAGR